MHACMRCTFLSGGERKKKNCFQNGTWYHRGWLKFFFFFMIFDFFFWFLVFYCRVTRVARGVFFPGGHWVGLGWVGVHYTTWGESLPSTGLQVHVTFFY